MSEGQSDSLTRANAYLWFRLPPAVGRSSVALGSLMADGSYLSAWRVFGGAILPACLVLGLILGQGHIGYEDTDHTLYMYSMTTMTIMVALSQLGASLGAALWLGFVVGDLSYVTGLAGNPPVLQVIEARALADVLLFGLLVAAPAAARGLSGKLLSRPAVRRPTDAGDPGRLPAEGALLVALAVAIVFLWTQATPVQLQATYTWQGVAPRTHGLQASMRQMGLALACTAGMAAALRHVLEILAAQQVGLPDRQAELRRDIEACRKGYTVIGAAVSTLVKAVLITVGLATYLTSWTLGVGAFVVVLAVLAAREVAFGYLDMGARLRTGIPLPVRLGAAMAAVFAVSAVILKFYWDADHTFMPPLIGAVASIVVFALFLPERAMYARRAAARSAAKQKAS